MYDATTVQLTARLRDSVPTLLAEKGVENVSLTAPIIGN
jgi:NAD(P)H-quinone oxidoreductase subunit 4